MKINKHVNLTKNAVPANNFLQILFLIRPEVAGAWCVSHLISINIADINVISNLTYCSVKTIH